MKNFLVYFFLVVFAGRIVSQVNDNCINAIPLCSNPNFTFFANSGPGSIVDFSVTSNVSNPTTNPFPPNIGCLNSGELNPQWLILTIGNAGLLEFVFGAGNSANPQAGFYDWSMWPYSPTACADIFNNTLPPIRCNWNGSNTGGTGLGSGTTIATFSGNSSNFGAPLPVNACQQFVICISNYSGVNSLVSFQSLGTASLSCNPNCNPNYAICYGASATIFPVNFAALANPSFSIQPGGNTNTTGSFVVTPSITSSYTTFITGVNANNAVQTITAVSTVTVNAQPLVAPTITNTSCTSTVNAVNLNLTFGPTGSANPPYTITWAPIPNGIQNATQTYFTGGIGAGVYNATIASVAGCSTTTTFTIDPPPEPAIIIINPLGPTYSITCYSPVLTLTAMVATNNYTWSSGVANFNGNIGVFTATSATTWMVLVRHPISNCTSTQTFVIGTNLQAPNSTLLPTLQNITCNLSSIITVSAVATPSVNVSHQFLSPQGGTFVVQTHTAQYTPGGVGIYTHCVVNNANGCSSCSGFTVTSNLGFPTYTLESPQNYTLGCNSTSIATIKIIGANGSTPGSPVTYTLIGPPTSSAVVSGSLSSQNVYTVTAPGTWTAITRDNNNFCETRTPFSILSNTFAPNISAVVPQQILDCNVPRIVLRGQSVSNNISYQWGFPAGFIQGDTVTVNTLPASPQSSVISNYTLIITDNSSTCTSFSIIPMYQNLYPPKAVIATPGAFAITCQTATLTLSHQSSTGIPAGSIFSSSQPVIGYIWQGPSPQVVGQVRTSYVAGTPGIYTLTVKDINNGCLAKTTTTVNDNRIYPNVNKPKAPDPFILDCGSTSKYIKPIITNTSTGYTYAWIAPPNTTVSPPPYRDSISVNQVGDYRVTITNTINGCSSSGKLIVINGTLNAAFDVKSPSGFAPFEAVFFNNSASSLGSSNITSYWSFGKALSATTTASNLSPSTTYSVAGTYKVTMFAVKGTCIDSASKNIEVEIPSSIEVPNVFTPNGDNVNDLFFLKAKNLESISILIYDRWGKIVFSSQSDKGNVYWDGKTQSGKESSEGTYFYIIKTTGKDGISIERKGTLSLYR